MKKIIYLGVLALVFSGCSVESIDSNDELITANAKPTLNDENGVAESFNFDPICAGVPADFCFSFPQATAGPNDKDTQVQIQLFVYGDDPNSTDDDDYEQIFKGEGGTEVCDSWTFDEPGVYDVRYKIGSGGFTNVEVEVQNCSCDESFSYTENGGYEYTFYYTPSEDMEAAELVFTFAQSVAISGLEDWEGNGQTEQKIMNLEKCVEYSWTVTLEKNCSGNSRNSNVWTDFKVNNVSKKNENTPNIEQSCD